MISSCVSTQPDRVTDELSTSRERRKVARRRAEPGWRAAVLDERASRHAFRLRASEEGSGYRAPASASGASNVEGASGGALSSASDDEVGGCHARLRERLNQTCVISALIVSKAASVEYSFQESCGVGQLDSLTATKPVARST
jgi:hypothetical protein